MADQTEQEPIERERYNAEAEEAYRIALEAPRPDILTAMHEGTLTTDMVFEWALHPAGDMGPFFLMIYSFLQTQVRERDAQIARKETALNMWRGWAQFVYLKGGPITLDDEALRAAVCVVHDDETATLRAERDAERQRWMDARCREVEQSIRADRAEAERDAAQQQIAEQAMAYAARVKRDHDEIVEMTQQIGVEFGYITMPDADCPDSAHQTLPRIRAALSTRPQEQPSEPDFIDIEPDIRVVRVYRDGSWLEDVKAGGRRRASFPLAIHQQGGHQP